MSIGTTIFEALAVAGLATSAAVAQAPPAAPTGGGPAYQRAGQLPARIMDFKAAPASIQPGQAVTLTWSTENPTNATIDPDVGRVTPRGARQLSPPRTTTYTLTVRGPNNQVLTRAVTVNVAGTTPAVESAAAADTNQGEAAKREVPRTANGKPDLSGVYDFSMGGGGRGRGGPAAGAAVPEGPVLKPGAEKFKVVRGPNDAGLTSDCMPLAGPQAFSVPYQFQIVESPHSVAILYGYPGTFRSIPTDGGPHSPDPDPTWMGESIGHWEGDTLVVDTVGFNAKTEINGFRHTEALHIVERFRRAEYNAIQYEATLEDPNVFVKPWTISRGFALRTDMSKVDEFVCENNPDYSKLFEKKK
jgi:plastocyanin